MRRLRLTLTISAVTAATFRLRARLRDKLVEQFSAFSPTSTIRVR